MEITDEEKLDNLKILLENQRTFHSIEIYPPGMFDERDIIKVEHIPEQIQEQQDSGSDQNPNNEQNIEYAETRTAISLTDSKRSIHDLVVTNSVDLDYMDKVFDPEILKYQEIAAYMKSDWISKPKLNRKESEDIHEEVDIPLYKFTIWKNIDGDMVRLSAKFTDWLFVIYGKSELFVDNLWIKAYRNGRLIHAANDLEYDIKLKMPNGTLRAVDQKGHILMNDKYDMVKYLKGNDKGFMDYVNIATSLSIMFGQTVCQLGSMVGEAAVAAQVISVGLNFLNQMQQNLITYGYNRGRCKHLVERCDNIITAMQRVPPDTLNLKFVISVIDRLKTARDLIDEYINRWRVTRFFSSQMYSAKFTGVNQQLSDCFYDFGVNLQISSKIFKYTE